MSHFLTGFEITASGLSSQRTRLNVVSSNLANAQTTRTAGGGPYLRRQAIFETQAIAGEQGFEAALRKVSVREVSEDTKTPTPQIFDPGHPDADANGYVRMPNVNVLEEMVDMVTASRSYEASATAFDTLKSMAMRALNIG